MATTGVLNGTDFLVYVDGTAISYTDGASLTITGPGTIPTSHKDMGNHLAKLKAKGYTWSMSASGLTAFDGAGIDQREIYDLFRENSTVSVKLATDESGDGFWSGDAVATNFSLDAPHNDASSFSCDFEGIGRLQYITT